MNPFRRIWPRELGLYLTALALLGQALMGIAHVAHAGPRLEPAFCAADHEQAPAHAPVPSCPLCQVPSFSGPVPSVADFIAAIDWIAIAFVPSRAIAVETAFVVLPQARAPPVPV
ncbi:MAG: hypothetical protein ACKO1J_02170 [Tagaea sp.]